MTTSVQRDWLEKTYESAQSNSVCPELPIGAPPKAHLLWDRGRCAIAFSCYRVESRCGAVVWVRPIRYRPFRLPVPHEPHHAPFPHPAHQTGRAVFPHPAFGQGITRSPTGRCASASPISKVPTRRTGIHRGSVRCPGPLPCASHTATGGAYDARACQQRGRPC